MSVTITHRRKKLIDPRTVLLVPKSVTKNLPENWHDVTEQVEQPGWLSRPTVELRTGREEHREKPFGVFSPGQESGQTEKAGETPLLVLGLGEVYGEELKELVERIQEKNRARYEEKLQRQQEHAGWWREQVWWALQRRIDEHKRNWRTDPAPNYVNPHEGKRIF